MTWINESEWYPVYTVAKAGGGLEVEADAETAMWDLIRKSGGVIYDGEGRVIGMVEVTVNGQPVAVLRPAVQPPDESGTL